MMLFNGKGVIHIGILQELLRISKEMMNCSNQRLEISSIAEKSETYVVNNSFAACAHWNTQMHE